MSRRWAAVLVVALSLAAYANILGNGFANDDEPIVAHNPVVTGGRWSAALLAPYWGEAREGAGLHRPVTVASFKAEWAAWRGAAFGFHAVNVAGHVAVSLLAGGALALAACVGACLGLRRKAPPVALGVRWFLLTLLPVTNLLFPVGTLVAERTLYLPSVGASMTLAGALVALPRPVPRPRLRALLACGLVAGAAFSWRTIRRNPTWRSTETVAATLRRDHPESYGAIAALGAELSRAGRSREAAEAYERALALAPGLYGLTVATADAEARAGHADRAEALLRAAVALRPEQPQAYRLLRDHLLRERRGREAHGAALAGLARVGPDGPLWGVVSEAYILKGDLDASIRARRAALGVEPGTARGWAHLAEVLDAAGRPEQAAEARARAHAAEDAQGGGRPGEGS